MKIVELDAHSVNPGDLSWDGIKELGELQLYDRTAPEEVIDRAKDADAILINKINITEDVIKSLPKLRYIGEMATGYNNIDIKAAANSGITVTNIPSYSTDSVAQLVFAHILNVASHVDHYARETRQGVWSRNQDFCYWNTPLIELAGKSIGIVGLGHIGMRVADRPLLRNAGDCRDQQGQAGPAGVDPQGDTRRHALFLRHYHPPLSAHLRQPPHD